MTRSDAQAVKSFGRQIASCIGRMASITLALIAHCKDLELRDLAIEEVRRINADMTRILDTFSAKQPDRYDA